MADSNRHLLVLSCSSTKLQTPGVLPAIERYDGPMYRVLRSFLRTSKWPENLSVAVLSARYGLIGGMAPIEYYDQRMDRFRAAELSSSATETLVNWSYYHNKISLVLGKDYLSALDVNDLCYKGIEPNIIEGPIGIKLNRLRFLLKALEKPLDYVNTISPSPGRPLYFLPDWEDMLDVNFDFINDRFSAVNKKDRVQQHIVQVMKPYRICDGILVSLAQYMGSKGILKKFALNDLQTLAPHPIREVFGLSSNQWVLGDCGAFSYVNEPEPTITTEQALSLYQLHRFDLGTSVDHMPVPEIVKNNKKLKLSWEERQQRVKLTRNNAANFIELHKRRKCNFTPVGIIQGIIAEDYARQLPEYIEMGYQHVAIGGLVPRSDAEIVEIIKALHEAKIRNKINPWIHLFGVFRPNIQPLLRELGVTSFDSATYFRKAWLRSGQNYLGTDGKWYAAIRVPKTSDPRTRKRLEKSNLSIEKIEQLEYSALNALHEYGKYQRSLKSTLKAVADYDCLLNRNEKGKTNFESAYKRTLEARPWEKCKCPVCSTIGIDVVIFRGYNRNKRRGAHNTLLLYKITSGGVVQKDD